MGRGLTKDFRDKARDGLQERRIAQGFKALSQDIGLPSGRMENLEQANLYYLWSVERVGVLYNLSEIDGKDWYRWGAEILVANQTLLGDWERGGYPGATPVSDTCLALLFLKRANLAKDLTAQLSARSADLKSPVDIGPKTIAAKFQSFPALGSADMPNPPVVIASKRPGDTTEASRGCSDASSSGNAANRFRAAHACRKRIDAPCTSERHSHMAILTGFVAFFATCGIVIYLIAKRRAPSEPEELEASTVIENPEKDAWWLSAPAIDRRPLQ